MRANLDKVTAYRNSLYPVIMQRHGHCSAVATCLSLHLVRPLSVLQQLTCSRGCLSYYSHNPKTFTVGLIYSSKWFAGVSVAGCLSLCVSLVMKLWLVLCVIHGRIIQTGYWAAELWIHLWQCQNFASLLSDLPSLVSTCLPTSALQLGLVLSLKLALGSGLVSDWLRLGLELVQCAVHEAGTKGGW